MEKSSAELKKSLEERKEYLEEMLKNALKQNEKLNSLTPHRIRVQKHGSGYQYYIRSDEKDTSGKYMKKEQKNLIKQTLQKEYLQKSIQIIKRELTILNQYLEKASPILVESYYENMNAGRKIMIDPLELDDNEYVKRWLSVPYKGKGFLQNMPEYYTQNMERVRSKSEIIIANTLARFNIPYRYEYPLDVKGMGTVFPDFTVLNVRKRKEMYWEHFGLIDDAEYRENAMRKVSIYEQNGIYLGDKLIITCESMERPLNVRELERKIEKYLV